MNDFMRCVSPFNARSVCGLNSRCVCAPYSMRNVLNINRAVPMGLSGFGIATGAGVGLGLAALAANSMMNNQQNNIPQNNYGAPLNYTQNPQYNQPMQQNNAYPQAQPMNNGYPQQNNGYPQPVNNGYPQQNNGYPQPMNNGYTQQNNGYAQPVNNGYPQQNNGYPQPMNNGYPNQTPPQTNNYNNVQPAFGANRGNVQPAYSAQPANAPTADFSAAHRGTIPQYNAAPQPQRPAPPAPVPAAAPAPAPTAPAAPQKPTPQLVKPVQKGMKTLVREKGNNAPVKVCLGWHTNNCDVDVSAFMLDGNEKVLGEDWFVFYGQPQSPDGALKLSSQEPYDMQAVSVDFARLNPAVKRIVFVVTINEALERRLNFSMLSDTYIRIVNALTNVEVVSFPISEYYSNITSMMVGELYLYNDQWKFNAIGNGVAKDLAGLCHFYGIETE